MKKQESGRSMVEMLGVLAIIGVLSIGGIAGYMLSMNRFRANNMIDKAGKFATVAFSTKQTSIAMGRPLADTDITYKTKELGALDSGEEIKVSSIGADGTVTLSVTFVNQDVCETALSILGETTKTCSEGKVALDFKQN